MTRWASVCTNTTLFTYQPHTANPQMIVNIITFWRMYRTAVSLCPEEKRDTVVMPKIMGCKCTAKTRTAAVNILGCSGAGAQRARVTRQTVQVIIRVNMTGKNRINILHYRDSHQLLKCWKQTVLAICLHHPSSTAISSTSF